MQAFKKDELRTKRLKYLFAAVVFAIASSQIPELISSQPTIGTIISVLCFICMVFFAFKYLQTVIQGR